MREPSFAMAGAPRFVLVHTMTELSFPGEVKGGYEAGSTASSSMRWLVRAIAALALVAAASGLGYAIAFQRGLDRLHVAAQQRLAVEAARLDGYLSRFEYLPSLLETSPSVFKLLGDPADPALQQSVSLYLKSINLLAGADNLYVLSVSGEALAAADFDDPGTPVGRDLSYRPYVSEALERGRGAFFGVGITSARAGYYLSYALKEGGATKGIAVVKINLDSLERGWRDLPGDALLLDERGVTILASREAWRYRPIAPLSREMLDDIARSKPYADYNLTPLGWTVIRSESGAARIATGNGADYTASELPINRGLWKLVLLDDEAPVRQTALIIGALSGVASVAALLALGLALQRRREIRQRLANQAALQAAHDMLEVRVQERTAELRAAQDELVHAGKLAALGQMSAGIVHELNQPLAALQTAADNAILLVDRGSMAEARGNLTRIGELVRRLGRLTGQLRVFAYKSSGPLDPIPVEQAVAESLKILAARIKEDGVTVVTDIEASLSVLADQTRLEQLLCNIVANALDAVESIERKSIVIRAAREEGQAARCRITISNSGPEIASDVLRRMFEPFVTTKPAGKGLGLGLMLSNHIARSFGGELHGRNLPDGAEFVVILPLAEMTEAALHGR
ncbi:ATP-binding protein [Bradyrhizobium sp. NC92]|uniref:sensor histidine kinase n=1 Tax=Bradyrhizobium sp. (strain NC92) TaxID=55395 RepID=UPI0021AAF2AC|nr:ATP-binding protein [Bradyrhizobium sp. NC92]UWU66239.1 ATP-binding protein [Bradyrhizobium sp. NC92]